MADQDPYEGRRNPYAQMFATGTGLLAAGLEAEGKLTPGSTQMLQQMGTNIANRMQDRWWKHEYDNWKTSSLQSTQLKTQQLQAGMAESLQEAAKIPDLEARRAKMNEIFANTTMQGHQLQQELFDSAAQYPNNPFIGQHADGIMQQTSQAFKDMSGVPGRAAELTRTEAQTVQAQEAAALSEARREELPAERARAEEMLELERRGVDIRERELELRAAQLEESQQAPFVKVMGKAHPVENPTQGRAQLQAIPGGMELLETKEGEVAADFQEMVNEDYLAVSRKEMTDEEFKAKHGGLPYDFFDKDSGEFNEDNYIIANRTEIRDEATARLYGTAGLWAPPPEPAPGVAPVKEAPKISPAAQAQEDLDTIAEENRVVSARIKQLEAEYGITKKTVGGLGIREAVAPPKAKAAIKKLRAKRAALRKEEKAIRARLKEAKAEKVIEQAEGTLKLLEGK